MLRAQALYRYFLLAVFFFLASLNEHEVHAAESSEVSFQKYEADIKDSKVAIERLIEEIFQESAEKLNAEQRGCSEAHLYRELRSHFNNHVMGDFIGRLRRSDKVDRVWIPLRESTLGKFRRLEAPGLWAFISGCKGVMCPVMKINGIGIGDDKFEHFFSLGFKYFSAHHLNKKPLSSAIEKGEKSERSYLGQWTTGLYSFGDLSANFNGARFWNHILAKEPDLLGSAHQRPPYFVCRKNQWHVNASVELEDYIDASWSEAINCSAFRNEKLLRKVQDQAQLLGVSCRENDPRLQSLMKKYEPYSRRIINLRGWILLDEVLKL